MTCKFILPEREKKLEIDIDRKFIGTGNNIKISNLSINLLSESKLGMYYEKMGLNIILDLSKTMPKECYEKAHGVALNIVENKPEFLSLGKYMYSRFKIPYILLGFSDLGIKSLYKNLNQVANFFKAYPILKIKAEEIISNEINTIVPNISKYQKKLGGKTAQLINMDSFRYINVITALKSVGIKVLIGGKTIDKQTNIIVGGLEEESIANKLKLGFCCKKREDSFTHSGYIEVFSFYEEILSSLQKFHSYI